MADWIRRLAVLTFWIVTNYLLSRDRLLNSFQEDLLANLALLVLVLGFREGQLIRGGGESYAVSDGTIIADFGELFREFLKLRG